jgi:hypothetical protein
MISYEVHLGLSNNLGDDKFYKAPWTIQSSFFE